MKKTLIVLALLASFQVADAQSNVNSAAKAVESALAASRNEKKATKVATWMKLAQTYLDAYAAPAGNVWLGADMNALQLSMGGEKPSSVETVTLNGAQYTKQVYENKNLYFNANGQLSVIEVVKPVVENALPKALEAYKKAYELDEKHSKDKDISAGIAKLSDCVSHIDTTAAGKVAAKDYLEQGFQKFPTSESIVFGLINYYMTSGEGTDRLFELLQQAKATSPDNASLYYVEGQAYKQLGDLDKAAKAYDESAAKDPKYVFAYIGKGQMYYDKALELQEKAQNELDDAKYMALVQDFEVTLKKCIDPFEQAYVVCEDPAIKSTIAEYLKQIYYRFRDQDPKYQAGYEKYNALLNN